MIIFGMIITAIVVVLVIVITRPLESPTTSPCAEPASEKPPLESLQTQFPKAPRTGVLIQYTLGHLGFKLPIHTV